MQPLADGETTRSRMYRNRRRPRKRELVFQKGTLGRPVPGRDKNLLTRVVPHL
jgi:hypothetical protein